MIMAYVGAVVFLGVLLKAREVLSLMKRVAAAAESRNAENLDSSLAFVWVKSVAGLGFLLSFALALTASILAFR